MTSTSTSTSTSSMLAGERRWASARRGGMTVLGKVAVPKPLNLPSQKLENHGLDPNVEIVPKGTLSWGSRSSASNPWGCSTVSPNADASTGSPSHPSGCPSSGGSGTRPSTAGSDKPHEPTANAWGPNSRPSSASGSLTSNQSSLTSLRPRSAETRPGSSQLSRFAEPSSDNSLAWGPSGAVEKLGVTSSKSDGFSLSSGDFPTLGSEKENSGKNFESQDVGSHGLPSSSSGRVPLAKENVKYGSANSWKRDDIQHTGEGIQPGPEKWQGDPQQYLNASIPPPHFDAWRGPAIGSPAGVWYRGPPGGLPYGTPVAPGGFPMEPFPYYRPQIRPAALANSHPVPPQGAQPRAHHPQNGDLYRPQIPDAYIRPGVAIRPGFYPGPVPYESYYGPPMGYCNANERDFPFMGMPAGPPVYNGYSAPNVPDPSNTHAIAGGRGLTGNANAPEQVDCGDENQGPYKVLVKQHNEWEGKDEQENWHHPVPADASCLVESDQPKMSLKKNEWGDDNGDDDEMYSRRNMADEKSLVQIFDDREGPSLDSDKVQSHVSVGNSKTGDDSWMKEPENEASSPKTLHQKAIINDSILMHKIEGLNAKSRGFVGRHDVASTYSREEQNNRLQAGTLKANSLTDEAAATTICSEKTHDLGSLMPSPYEVVVSAGDKTLDPAAASGTSMPRRAYHGMQARVDRRGKGRYNSEDADGWRRKPIAAGSSGSVGAANNEPASAQDRYTSVETSENSQMSSQSSQRKDEVEFSAPIFDQSDSQGQRDKMREFAKQRAVQLQKEEEERTREQKAKALAKLEELNRCTQEKPPPTGAAKEELEEFQILGEPMAGDKNCEASGASLVSNPDVITQSNEVIAFEGGDSVLGMPKNAQQEPLVPHGQSLPSGQEVQFAHASDFKAALHVNDGGASRQKRIFYKQKQNIPSEKSLAENLNPLSTMDAAKSHIDVAADGTAVPEAVTSEVGSSTESNLPRNANIVVESSAHQRRKNHRSGRIKHKLDETSSVAALPSPEPKEIHLAKASAESGKPEASQLKLDPSLIQSVADDKVATQPSEQSSSLPSEEAHGRANSLWKAQHSRRMPRNQQANRLADKYHSGDAVIWARVRSQNKADVADETIQKTIPNNVSPAPKSDDVVQNNMKSKRAEMERYVPKQVAKELAQQGSQQPISLSSQATWEETAGRAESGFQSTEISLPASSTVGDVGSIMESKVEDTKQNKQAKSHGAWRQRSSTESSCGQGLPHGSSSSSEPKSVQRSTDQDESLEPDVNPVKAQPKCTDEGNVSDGWNTANNCDAAAPFISTVVKDQGVAGKGKRHPYKGYRSMGNNSNLDHKNLSSEEPYRSHIQSAVLEISHTDSNIASKESRGPGERTVSHWQPKSQAYSGNSHRGSQSGGGQNLTADVRVGTRKDSTRGRLDHPPQPDRGSSEVRTQPQPGQTVSESKDVAEAPLVGHLEARREKKVASSGGQPYATDEGPVSPGEPRASSADGHSERSGVRRNGNQNNRSARVHDSYGDWSYSGQDNRQHIMPLNRERNRHSSHYEYQPVGSYNNSKSNKFVGQMDGSHNGPRYRERGQAQPRRGGG